VDEEQSIPGPPIDGLLESEVGDELSIYHPATQEALLLNQTASDIWRLVDGTRSVAQIVDALAVAYQVDTAEIAPEVERVISDFEQRGLVPRRGSDDDVDRS
jgi:hypothetical protein